MKFEYEVYGELICDGGSFESKEKFETEKQAREYGKTKTESSRYVKWWDVRRVK
jgi:hypothetical protein